MLKQRLRCRQLVARLALHGPARRGFTSAGSRFPSYYDRPRPDARGPPPSAPAVADARPYRGAPDGDMSAAAAGSVPGEGASVAGQSLQQRLHAAMEPAFGSGPSTGGQSVGGSAGASPQNPVHVVSHQPSMSFRQSLWRLARWVAGGWLLISLASVYLEEMGKLTKGHGLPMDVALAAAAAPSKKVTFADVQGIDEVKAELQEIVEFLRDPSRFTRLGGKLPKGVLLTGQPGTGKTLLARAIAGEAGVPFLHCSGSDFDEMFVGVGAKRVRELFATAKKSHPCIIFIDEIDAIGSKRNPRDQGFAKMTLNQLLVELDGFAQNEGIIVIGATNFPESLDNALVRPGRFDRKVHVPLPDVKGRTDILRVHLRNVPVAAEVDIRTIARGTSGFSGAELANLVNLAAIKAATEGHAAVNSHNMEYAIDRIIMGTANKTVMSAEERRLTAYHEAGHALVGIKTEGARPVHKATIVPHGRALGMVVSLPKDDEYSVSRKQYLAMMDVAMGGKVAEELVFGADRLTGGASSDLQSATAVASMMVTRFGMSGKVGPVAHEDIKYLSSERKAIIENEVQRLTEEAQERVVTLLKKHSAEHRLLAEALLEFETLTGAEIGQVLRGEKLVKAEQLREAGGVQGDAAGPCRSGGGGKGGNGGDTKGPSGPNGIKQKLPHILN